MKIVHVASELFPYVKTGGLADAVGSLTRTLAARGHEVAVFVPGYRAVLGHEDVQAAERILPLRVELGDSYASGEVRCFSPARNLTVFVVCREEHFDRSGIYGNGQRDYEDNDARFLFFTKAVVETLRMREMHADIVHAHDWQTALVPLLLRLAEQRHGVSLALKTAFTIHNIAFQGVFPLRSFGLTGLPGELLGIDGIEYYQQISFMKGGILFADRVTTVSPRYAQEIQTPEFGCGLEGVVATRADELVGLVNGIDPSVWNPSLDALLPARYSPRDLAGKKVCRAELLRETGLTAADDVPIFGMVCRLTAQKGLGLLLENRDFFLAHEVRLIVLGIGERRYEEELRGLVLEAPGKIHLCGRLDERMSHLVEAGSDFFLMPSLFEPCGLNQMYSQIYGTLPVVTRVGGLIDTVYDLEAEPALGTGIMVPPTAEGLALGLRRALALWREPKQPRYAAAQLRGMRRDFSWTRAAVGYEQLYAAMI